MRDASVGRTKLQVFLSLRAAELAVREAAAQAILDSKEDVPRSAQLAFSRLSEFALRHGFMNRGEAYGMVADAYRSEAGGEIDFERRGELVNSVWSGLDDYQDQALAVSEPGGSDEDAKTAGETLGKSLWNYARAEVDG